MTPVPQEPRRRLTTADLGPVDRVEVSTNAIQSNHGGSQWRDTEWTVVERGEGE